MATTISFDTLEVSQESSMVPSLVFWLSLVLILGCLLLCLQTARKDVGPFRYEGIKPWGAAVALVWGPSSNGTEMYAKAGEKDRAGTRRRPLESTGVSHLELKLAKDAACCVRVGVYRILEMQ